MTDAPTADAHGVRTDASTLTIRRLLPASIERVWAYLTDGDLRRQWFAAGDMPLRVGAPIELIWRNDALTDPSGRRPEGIGAENRMQSRITELDPPRRLAIAWGAGGEVCFELSEQGGGVLLTVIHRGIPDRDRMLSFAPGWHMHLDILKARLGGPATEPFWDGFARLQADYAERLPL